jgi:hypothetical protein
MSDLPHTLAMVLFILGCIQEVGIQRKSFGNADGNSSYP